MKQLLSKKEILPIALIALAYIVGHSAYSCLPDMMPSHWNIQGEVDSWASKDFTVYFYPSLMLGIYLLMLFLPLIDPLKKNYEKFKAPYYWLRTLLVFFLFSIYIYTIAAGAGYKGNISYFIIPAISLLFIVMGVFLPKIKKNYFVGIKTPWTLHSEEVWDKTHKMGGKLFIAAGVMSLLSILIPQYSFYIFMAAVLTAAFGSIIYSYFAFRQSKKNN